MNVPATASPTLDRHLVLDAVPTSILVIDAFGVITDVNQAARRTIAGGHDIVGRPFCDTVSGWMRSDPMRTPLFTPHSLERALTTSGWTASDATVIGPARTSFSADCTVVPVADAPSRGAVVVITEAGERESLRARLAWDASHDALTQLPNRALVIRRLEESLVAARSTGEWPGILSLDIDNFRRINETYGQAGGDALLVMLVDRVASMLRAGDTLARMGGDEFLVLCEGVDTRAQLSAAADRLASVLAQPFVIGDAEVSIGVSLGAANADPSTASADSLLSQAEIATAHAKDQSRNRVPGEAPVRVPVTANSPQSQRDGEIVDALRGAIERNEFHVVYQPIAQVSDGRLIGFEALLRWNSETLGAVSPGQFIPVAERMGLMGAIGAWVLDVAARDAASWQAARGTDLAVHVNIAEVQFQDPGLARQVASLHQRHGLAEGTLTLEITEEMLVGDPGLSIAAMSALRAAGASIALDDFGTGHVSLADLRHFPLRTFKIDREFVSGMPTSDQDRRIVQAIIELAHGLGQAVVAEGVEKDAELALLQELGCDMAQGWLFGHPLSAAEALLVAASATSRQL